MLNRGESLLKGEEPRQLLRNIREHDLTKDTYHLERGCSKSAGNSTFRPPVNPSTPSPAGSTTSCPSTCFI